MIIVSHDLWHQCAVVLGAVCQERFSQEGSSGNEQITTLQSQVEEVKGVMTQNIERVLERGQRLEELMDKTTDLEANVCHTHNITVQLHVEWLHSQLMCTFLSMFCDS